MSEIRRYVLVDSEDNEQDYEYSDWFEAARDAEERNYAVVARIYTFADSELVWTPDGSNTWPPATRSS